MNLGQPMHWVVEFRIIARTWRTLRGESKIPNKWVSWMTKLKEWSRGGGVVAASNVHWLVCVCPKLWECVGGPKSI